MEFLRLNWIAIVFATVANTLLAYLFFDSPFATRWKSITGDRSGGRNNVSRYLNFITYSALLVVLMLILFNEQNVLGSVFAPGFVLMFLTAAVEIMSPSLSPKSSQYRIGFWFILLSTFIASIFALFSYLLNSTP